MRALRQTLLHGLCGTAGFWFVSSPDQAAPPADDQWNPFEPVLHVTPPGDAPET
jgi:hypothetical protein